ncbi:serine/threonine protein kinase [Myxococcota bacterium]
MSRERSFGRYVLDRRLAVGGMAEVFVGHVDGPDGLRQKVAIKRILPAHRGDPSYVKMFLDEAKIAAGFNHPNLVRTYALVRIDGHFCIVMEYIEGRDLEFILRASRSRATPIPFETAAHIVAEAAEGLHHAHELRSDDGRPIGIVHRDVAPANIIVTSGGGIKVVDFGVAKHEMRDDCDAEGELKGRLSHMAPEVFRGQEVDCRSDVFALGTVLYELVTLSRCFLGRNMEETLELIDNGNYEPARAKRPDLPQSLKQIIDKSLARQPRHRYATAAELSQDLRRFVKRTRVSVARDIRNFVVRFLDAGMGPVKSVSVLSPALRPSLKTTDERGDTKASQNRRREPRRVVAWEAECRLGGCATLAVMRDVSERGAFVVPATDIPGIGLLDQTELARLLKVGDQFVLTYTERPFSPAIQTIATLKWSGYSQTHRCHGYGLAFPGAARHRLSCEPHPFTRKLECGAP